MGKLIVDGKQGCEKIDDQIEKLINYDMVVWLKENNTN